MALSSVSVAIHRDNSPSLSPLSPTIIHYHKKYQLSKISHQYHRKIERHHRFPKQQQIRKPKHRNSSFQYHSYNQKSNKVSQRQQRQSTSIWETHRSSNGRIYYYNTITDQSQWEKPSRDQSRSTSSSKRSIQSTLNLISDDDDDIRSIDNNKKQNNSINSRQGKDNIEHFEEFLEEKTTPTSPPPNEIIQIDHVDPFPTFEPSQHQSYEDTFKNSHLQPSLSTINAILQLQYLHSNSNDIKQYDHNNLNEHLLNWPITQNECERIRIETYQLISLRTELYILRLRFQRNRFYLLKYSHKS
ncbi:unnamed protein product [Adineta steineri]|uniref:WW domain-containing protein n=1 Tax=Adineta steineri TaxID=433720 RepID=A0A813QB97_9BILA|nr:unnamed protein product [Adineta steineri]CAF1031290.1 unnamed protein product [Adineta steineri]